MALAMVGALGPIAYHRSMSRKAKVKAGPAPRPRKTGQPEAPVRQEAAPAARAVAPKRRRKDSSALEQRIGYSFADKALLDCALTHISAISRGPQNRGGSYQRLEFLGDHVLGMVISDMLFRLFPNANEGELSRRLAGLVRKETCAEVARAIDLGAAIKLGGPEAQAGTRNRVAILADVCEALIGAVYLDGGYAAASELIGRLWRDPLRSVRPLRDPKTLLQEWAQARGLPTPTYREIARTGPHHEPEFRVIVELPDRPSAEGLGRSKRAAEQAAAAMMLKQEGVSPGGGDA
jgi:ribonuclease-3